MSELDSLFSSVKSVREKIEELLSMEKDVSAKEEKESAELRKVKKLASQLQRSDGGFGQEGHDKIVNEELEDFAEAVNLFERISKELDSTADELQSIVSKMQKNSSEELEIIEDMASDSLQIKSISKAEELADTISYTQTNTSKILKESKKARTEAQEAQKELTLLMEMDGIIKEVDSGKHNLSKPEKKLSDAKDNLEDAEWKLGEIPDMIEEIERANTNLNKVLRENSSR